jgi:glycosyltransferase involved in cell wall biosynthesis
MSDITKPLKIVVLNQGVSRSSRFLYRELAHTENVTMIVPQHWNYSFLSFSFEPEDKESPLKVISRKVRFQDNLMLWHFKYNDLKEIFRELQPDIILTDGGPANPLTVISIMAAKKVCPKAKHINFTWHNLDYRFFSLKTWGARLIQLYTFPRLNMLLAGTKAGVNIFRKEKFKNTLLYWPLVAIDKNKWRSGRTPEEREKHGISGFAILFSGRIVHEKGVDLLWDAIRQLPEDCKLYLVGNGEMREELELSAEKDNMKDRIIFMGSKNPDELPDLYRLFDAFVLPSRSTRQWVEQFGIVTVEAMASGLPAIGSSSGAIPDVIGEGGMVFQENNSAELLTLLKKLYDTPKYYSEMQAHSVERARVFSSNTVAEKFSSLCHDLTNTK